MFKTALTVAKEGDIGRAPDGLPGKLEWLCRFGRPSMSRHEDGWHCRIKMNTNTTGSEFTVMSEFKHATPLESVNVLIERMLEALSALNVKP